MSHFKAALLILAFIFSASMIAVEQSTSSAFDGNQLLPKCQAAIGSMDGIVWKNTDEAWGAGICGGLVAGIGYASALVCLPDGVTIGQQVRVVVKYLNDHPEQLQHDERNLIDVALASSFPCKKK